MLPHVALYPPAKNPKVVENRTRRPMLPCDVRPQKRRAERAELRAEIQITVVAGREKRLLELRYPKEEHAMMPGALKSVRSRVADVWERWVTSRAYVFR